MSDPDRIAAIESHFSFDDPEITYRSVSVVRARRDHLCYGIDATTHHTHTIPAGERYILDKCASLDGWCQSRICITCADKLSD